MDIPENMVEKTSPWTGVRSKEQGGIPFGERDQRDVHGLHSVDNGCDFRLQKVDPKVGREGILKSSDKSSVVGYEFLIIIKWGQHPLYLPMRCFEITSLWISEVPS